MPDEAFDFDSLPERWRSLDVLRGNERRQLEAEGTGCEVAALLADKRLLLGISRTEIGGEKFDQTQCFSAGESKYAEYVLKHGLREVGDFNFIRLVLDNGVWIECDDE